MTRLENLIDCEFWIDYYTNRRPSGKSRAFWRRAKRRVERMPT